MSNLEIIEGLCQLAEAAICVIGELAEALEQERALTDAEREAVADVGARYRGIIDAEETPDTKKEESV